MSQIKQPPVGGTVGTKTPAGTAKTGSNKPISLQKDGLGEAAAKAVTGPKGRQTLESGKLPAPDKSFSMEEAANVASISAKLVSKDDEAGKMVLDFSIESLTNNAFRGASVDELEGAEAILANTAGIGAMDLAERDRLEKMRAQTHRQLEALSNANSDAVLEAKGKVASEMEATVLSKYVTEEKAAGAASSLKLGAEDNPNTHFMAKLAGLIGDISGTGPAGLVRAFYKVQENLAAAQAANSLKANAKPVGQVGGQMFGKGAGAPATAGGTTPPGSGRFGGNGVAE